MTEMTELEAVRRLCAPLEETAIISDGADDWTPASLIAELEGDEEVQDLTVVPGETVRRLDADGYLVSGEPMYRVKAEASVTIQGVEEWVAEHVPEALKAMQEVVASPEVSVRPCFGGPEYWVWRDGAIPETVQAALGGVSLTLDSWANEVPPEVPEGEAEDYRAVIREIDAALETEREG